MNWPWRQRRPKPKYRLGQYLRVHNGLFVIGKGTLIEAMSVLYSEWEDGDWVYRFGSGYVPSSLSQVEAVQSQCAIIPFTPGTGILEPLLEEYVFPADIERARSLVE